MKIGIFGGTFNPPHKMHKQIAIELLNNKYLDKVIYVPVSDNYNKPNILNGIDRVKMLELMISNIDDILSSKIEVSSFEVDGSLHTINTLNHFKTVYPDDDIYFICGTDNLDDFHRWNSFEEILKNYKLLVISRDEYNYDEIIKKFGDYSKNIFLAPISSKKISSTQIRKEIIKNGFSNKLNNYIDNSTIDYLKNIDILKYWN